MFQSYLASEFRNGYNKKPGDKENGCVFCKRYKKKDFIFATKSSFVIANEYPYNYGHLMIMSARHVKDIRDLKDEELTDLFSTAKKFLGLEEKLYDVKSFNIGFNIGPASGATLEHLHLHLVPRWVGDAGFLETTASTRNLKESPSMTAERLKKALKWKE